MWITFIAFYNFEHLPLKAIFAAFDH